MALESSLFSAPSHNSKHIQCFSSGFPFFFFFNFYFYSCPLIWWINRCNMFLIHNASDLLVFAFLNFPSVFYCFQKSHFTASVWETPRIHRNGFKMAFYIFWSEGFALLLLNCWKESLPWVRLPGHLTLGSVRISPMLETGAPSLFLLYVHVHGLWAALPCFSAINTVMGEDKVLCHNSMSSSLLNQLIYIATPCLSFPTCLMSIIARNLFFSAVWNLGDVDHIASLCCSSKHSPEVTNVIPCNTDSTLGISGEEVSKAVSQSHCKWRELLRNLSHPLHSHSSPSLGQKFKTKKWSDRKDLKNLFFFFF